MFICCSTLVAMYRYWQAVSCWGFEMGIETYLEASILLNFEKPSLILYLKIWLKTFSRPWAMTAKNNWQFSWRGFPAKLMLTDFKSTNVAMLQLTRYCQEQGHCIQLYHEEILPGMVMNKATISYCNIRTLYQILWGTRLLYNVYQVTLPVIVCTRN